MTEQIFQEAIQRLAIGHFGGLNVNDAADTLFSRSHAQDGAGNWQQRPGVGMEFQSLSNVEYFPNGITSRLGSVEAATLVSLLQSGETLLECVEWRIPTTNTRILFAVGTKAAYTNQSGSWAQLKYPNSGATAYTHPATITKCSIRAVDNHLCIGLDSTNYIKTYRSGAALDDHLRASTTTTTVDADSNSGQTVLNVAATTMFAVGDRVRINSGGARDESGYVASIQAGVSLTLMDNLTYTHTAAQADVVQVQNIYTDAYGSATHTITGTWESGAFLLESINERLVYSTGNGLVRFTPRAYTASSGVWDLAGNAGNNFYTTPGNVRALAKLKPATADNLLDVLVIFTAQGPLATTGFDPTYDQPVAYGHGVPMNHRCIAQCAYWLVYLGEDRNIYGFNGGTEIDLGRRFKAHDGTGPLDEIDLTESLTDAHAVYDSAGKKWLCWVTTDTSYTCDLCLGLDFHEGEPHPSEPQGRYETHVRLLVDRIKEPGTNAWFIRVFPVLGGLQGITGAGKVWTLGSGRYDLGTLGIDSHYQTGWFRPGGVAEAQFLTFYTRGVETGDWTVTWNLYTDYATVAAATFSEDQIAGAPVYDTALYDDAEYGATAILRGDDDTDLYAEAISFRQEHAGAGQFWQRTALELEFLPGERERVA